MAKQDDYVRYTVRLPRELYSMVEALANESSRSVNAEITELLEKALDRDFSSPVEIVRLKPLGININDAAAILGVSVETLNQFVQEKRISPPMKFGAEFVLPTKEVERLARSLFPE
ncbi:helix-turn-helix transcriptional regulator [Rhizobium oryziradicis]|uniref:Arc-like DNA binding domain-containing protein n=1 Tax=Rhizobium oryziradicis TaxID=1867956 RepID=A0A1Q8ZRA9_9HYPH|nr:Arc family DNA-binding protein [Rhizobium oryziradicis]OLP44613.1 hypothetical protein BJF95_08910 [Rhizobium oryziradicis]